MSWKIIQFMDENPQLAPKDVIAHFASELEVDEQLHALQGEVDEVLALREELRPLYSQKINAEMNITLLNSEFEMQVMAKFPPRKGTDKDRKAYKLELQQNDSRYMKSKETVEKAKAEIEELEYKQSDIQQRAKNARRILDTFNGYMNFVIESSKHNTTASAAYNKPLVENGNVF